MASEKEKCNDEAKSQQPTTSDESSLLPPLLDNNNNNNNNTVIDTETRIAATEHLSLIDPLGDCNDALLDSMDGCVDYVEGINSQYASSEHPQYYTTRQINSSLMTLPQELDYLNLCGIENETDVGIQTLELGENTGNNGSSPSTSPAHATSPAFINSCAVCMEEETAPDDEDASNRIIFAKLPCCGKANATSTVQICTCCIILLSSPTSDGSSRVGKCPRCRSWIVIATPEDTTPAPELVITTVQAAGQCRVCNQVKDHLVEEDAVCDACFFGRRYPLLYECSACHTTQRIPHPMYRYQPSPIEFGTVTWACHGLCMNFTKWRIRPEQVRLIPVGDTPEAWGADFVEVARARLQQERQATVPNNESEQCLIL